MYRIISGKWKAKKILAPKNFEVRPTTDFAKEALLSIIENKFEIENINFLDLFAGIGSISLEFASRGCSDITSIDFEAKHIGFINKTSIDLGFLSQIYTIKQDVFDFLKKNKLNKQFNLIFADPPFEFSIEQYQKIISEIKNNDFLKENGEFILEHSSKIKIEDEKLIETRKYGNITFSFFKF